VFASVTVTATNTTATATATQNPPLIVTATATTNTTATATATQSRTSSTNKVVMCLVGRKSRDPNGCQDCGITFCAVLKFWVTPQKCPFTLSVSTLNVSITGCPVFYNENQLFKLQHVNVR
jgi:hypothetical protein